MRASEMWWVCRFCKYARELWYADGHNSIQCVHPVNDDRTTRDVSILDRCPEGKEPHGAGK